MENAKIICGRLTSCFRTYATSSHTSIHPSIRTDFSFLFMISGAGRAPSEGARDYNRPLLSSALLFPICPFAVSSLLFDKQFLSSVRFLEHTLYSARYAEHRAFGRWMDNGDQKNRTDLVVRKWNKERKVD